MPVIAWLGLFVSILLLILLAINENKHTRDISYSLGGVLLGIAIGGVVFWYWSVSVTQGVPLAKFYNGDVYQIVSLDPVIDDGTTICSMRRVGASEDLFGHGKKIDLNLRVYRLPDPVLEPFEKMQLPIYVRTIKIGDAVSFQMLSKDQAVTMSD